MSVCDPGRGGGRHRRALGIGQITLAKLIQRLYVPESGRVLVDGTISAWPTRPGFAARSASCCRRTCCSTARSRDNIALADPALPIERVIAAANLPAPTISFSSFPEGYDTIVDERGIEPFGRPTPAHRHRARAHHRSAHLDFRRGNERARLRKRAHHPREYAGDRQGAHGLHHCPSALRPCATPDRILTIERGRLVEDGTTTS